MNDILIKLDNVINERKNQIKTKSYSATLLNKGVAKCAEKFGEEAIELIVASSSCDSTLKHIMSWDKANLISSSVFPTPENTVFLGSPPASITRDSSPPETISKPEPNLDNRDKIDRFELAFTE